MTFPERRLAELDRIARERPLTDAEQREVMRRVRECRQNQTRRERYASDPLYRNHLCNERRAFRRSRRKVFCMERLEDQKERLAASVSINDVTGCWNWLLYRNKKGYGVTHTIFAGSCKSILAHRYSYELHIGAIPDGMMVCHRCDNPRCINPDHLFVGAHDDNMRDMTRKRRASRINVPNRGSGHGMSKLTEASAMEILARAGTATLSDLAREYGVSPSTISRIIKGKGWKHIGGPDYRQACIDRTRAYREARG